jgi:peptidylprolyl isomerase
MNKLLTFAALGGALALAACSQQPDTTGAAKAPAEAAPTEAADAATAAIGPQPIPAPADVAAAPADAVRTPSGLAYKVLRKGSGTAHPTGTSVVEVHYTGWTTDGRMFDSSRVRGETASFPLDRVIKGWTEGVQLMVTGEETRFWIPAELAYGANPRPGAPQGTLVFDVELIAIK